MPTITLPNGDKRPFDRPVSGAELAASIGPGLAKAALAVSVDGEVKDLSHVITHDAKVAIVTKTSPEALELLRHALVGGDDLVEGVGDLAGDAFMIAGHTNGEVPRAHRL